MRRGRTPGLWALHGLASKNRLSIPISQDRGPRFRRFKAPGPSLIRHDTRGAIDTVKPAAPTRVAYELEIDAPSAGFGDLAAASRRVTQAWPAIARSNLLRMQLPRIDVLALRGCGALTGCADHPYDPDAPALDPEAPRVHITTPALGAFAGDVERGGNYFGYDGPFPPFNDSLVHHYVFTVYALDVHRLTVTGAFTGQDVRNAMHGHILAQASLTVTYSLNPAIPA